MPTSHDERVGLPAIASNVGRSRGAMLLAAVAYATIGVLTAELARSASSPRSRTTWRLAAWLLSFAVFLGHTVHERLRMGNTTVRSARHVALAAALGAFLLAAAGPVRSHWAAGDIRVVALLSLGLWPLITGLPAFLVALAVGHALGLGRPSMPTNGGHV